MKCAFLASALLGLTCSGLLAAEEIVAVVGSQARPYQETLEAFQGAVGQPVKVINLSETSAHIPRTTRLIVAIGGKAALESYPKDVPLLYCLAPGILVPSNGRKAPTAKIYMTPKWPLVMSALKDIQPGLRTLGIVTLPESQNEFNSDLEKVGESFKIKVIVDKLDSSDDLPDHLRRLGPLVNALWIPPDPLVITANNYRLIKAFCQANHMPLYVPTVELVESGVVAGVAPSFKQVGEAAGQTAKKMLEGTLAYEKIFPESAVVAVNLPTAEACGLRMTEAQLKKIDRLIP